MIELPISTLATPFGNIAFCGGGYLRLFPYKIIKWGIKNINKQGKIAIVYLHPSDIDTKQPKLNLSLKRKFKRYYNLNATIFKIENLLKDFSFQRADKVLGLDG
ncbi:MAG: DUF3473 domain-containing protein [Deltaproteobacteria bacterium]|nr:DUF3473 domain-containing protein [Deltaproteobacteria bacterium]